MREKLPPRYPVSVRIKKFTSAEDQAILGYCEKKNDKFVISLREGLNWNSAVMILLHEWAHTLAWSDNNHGEKWAKAYSKCWRTIIDDKEN